MRYTLETKNIVIFGVWTFVIVMMIMLFWRGQASVAGIGGPFVASLLVFIVAMVFSYGFLMTKPIKKD
jgi:hypothetical protein